MVAESKLSSCYQSMSCSYLSCLQKLSQIILDDCNSKSTWALIQNKSLLRVKALRYNLANGFNVWTSSHNRRSFPNHFCLTHQFKSDNSTFALLEGDARVDPSPLLSWRASGRGSVVVESIKAQGFQERRCSRTFHQSFWSNWITNINDFGRADNASHM